MMIKITYARGNINHITGNEPVFTEIVTEEYFKSIRYDPTYIFTNITRA